MTDNKPLHKILIISGLLMLTQGCTPEIDSLPVSDQKIYLVHIRLQIDKANIVDEVSTSVYTYRRMDDNTDLITTDENMKLEITYGDSIISKTLDLVNRDGVDFINHVRGTQNLDSLRFFLYNKSDTLLLWIKPLKVAEKTKVVFKVDSGKTEPHIQFQCILNRTGSFIGHRFATPVFTYPSMNNGFNNRRFTAYALDSLALGNGWYRYPLPLFLNPERFDSYIQMSYAEKLQALEIFMNNNNVNINILSLNEFDAIQALWQSQAYTYDPFRLPKNPEAYTDDSPFVLYIENTLELRSSP